ncbi:hypothetical protein OS175_00475 [Marinicella sp. S1101]|uniref:hypothetical protein n=1 Tax=Marinicella marina TaxID=2996016 RepID=UPI00226103B7|nr:hypothetical protein [Marinicella marina]MCX7552337.1 hypothetical protein [Marinicella marina]MDJ1139212.1 hypothetical protein [Marinicella marina]
MKSILLIIVVVALAACGSNPNKVAAVKVGDELYKPDNSAAMALDNDTKEKIVCERRIVTGSHRKQKVCTTVGQKERDREAAQQTIESNATLIQLRLAEEKGG